MSSWDKAEGSTSPVHPALYGHIDVLIQTDKYVYIIELKHDKDPDDTLDQIDEKGYDWPFIANGRKVFKIGALFSTKNRRLEDCVIDE